MTKQGKGKAKRAVRRERGLGLNLEAFLTGLGIPVPETKEPEVVTMELLVGEIKQSVPAADQEENDIELQMAAARTKLERDSVAGALSNLAKAHESAERLVVTWLDPTLAALLSLYPRPKGELYWQSLGFYPQDESIRFRTQKTAGTVLNIDFSVGLVAMAYQTGDHVRLSEEEKNDGVTTVLTPRGEGVLKMIREFFDKAPEFPQLYLRLMRVRRTVVGQDKTLKLDNETDLA